jgi:integrase
MALSQPFVWHDLRRTCAAGMQRLGVRTETIEQVLNHRSGSYRGIIGVYQVDPMHEARRDALQRWADHVDAVVRGEPAGKVVPIRMAMKPTAAR